MIKCKEDLKKGNMCIKGWNIIKTYIFLYIGFIIYSLSSVMNKKAAFYEVFSMPWIFWYGCGIMMLAIYAVLWQQVLKRMKLVTAYANRALVTPLGLVWGYFLFSEKISVKKCMGVLIIVVGVIITVSADNSKSDKDEE